MDDIIHALRILAEWVIAVSAGYAAYRSKRNATLTTEVKRELEANPAKCVNEMVKANGPLSESMCRARELAEQLLPGESRPGKLPSQGPPKSP